MRETTQQCYDQFKAALEARGVNIESIGAAIKGSTPKGPRQTFLIAVDGYVTVLAHYADGTVPEEQRPWLLDNARELLEWAADDFDLKSACRWVNSTLRELDTTIKLHRGDLQAACREIVWDGFGEPTDRLLMEAKELCRQRKPKSAAKDDVLRFGEHRPDWPGGRKHPERRGKDGEGGWLWPRDRMKEFTL